MESQGLEPKPEAVPALKGDVARAAFIEKFREVQRLKTQLDQYTDLTPETEAEVEQLLPKDELNAFRAASISRPRRNSRNGRARRRRTQQPRDGRNSI